MRNFQQLDKMHLLIHKYILFSSGLPIYKSLLERRQTSVVHWVRDLKKIQLNLQQIVIRLGTGKIPKVNKCLQEVT